MRLKVTMLVILLMMAGCATTQERFTTNNHIAAEPAIYNQMILDNLVNITENPAELPYFATLDSGIPQVADGGSFGGFWSFMPQTLVKQLHNQHGGQVGPLTASRSVQVNWTLKPVNDDNRLKAMRCVYLWVLGLQQTDMTDCEKLLKKYFPLDSKTCTPKFDLSELHQCWLRKGPWHKRPSNAHYYIHRHLTAYWVDPAFEKDFAQVGLVMRRIALHAPRTTVTRLYDYSKDGFLARQRIITGGAEPDCDELTLKKLRAGLKVLVPAGKGATRDYAQLKRLGGKASPLDERQQDVLLNMPLTDIIEKEVNEQLLVPGKFKSIEELKKEIDRVTSQPHLKDIITRQYKPVEQNQPVDRQQDAQQRQDALKHDLMNVLFPPAPVSNIDALPSAAAQVNPWNAFDSLLNKYLNNAVDDAAQEVADQSTLPPDPELTIDTFSNPEISPGLITLPH